MKKIIKFTVIEAVLELLAVIALAVFGRIYYGKMGFYPDARHLIDSIRRPDHYAHVSEAIMFIDESFIFTVSMIVFVLKILAAQVLMIEESICRAVFSFLSDAVFVASSVLIMLVYDEKISLNRDMLVFIMIASIILTIITFIHTSSALLPISHGIQMLVEFVGVPLILTLTQYSLKTVLGWIAVAVIGVIVAYGFLTSKSSGVPSAVSEKMADLHKIGSLRDRINLENNNIIDRTSRLNRGCFGATKSGVRSANIDSRNTISILNKQIDDIIKKYDK